MNVAAAVVATAIAVSAYAQDPGYASAWTWEIQTPGSDVWRRGVVEVPEETSFVRVRARVVTTGPRADEVLNWGFSRFDATVAGVDGAGAGDRIDVTGWMGLNSPPPVASRVGGVLKIDRADDHEPPGLGPGWYDASDDFPDQSPATLTLLAYTLQLDGPGVREIDQVFGYISPSTTPSRPWRVYGWINSTQSYNLFLPLMTLETATLRVIPCPNALPGLIVIVLAARRRR